MQRAAWRRPFWSVPHIGRFGAAFERLHRNSDSVSHWDPLVLGLVMNYTADQIAPFVLSLREAGYSGQIVFLTANLSEETTAFLRAHSVGMIPFDPQRFAPYHPQNARWFAYLEFLLGLLMASVLPRSIFLTDVRDVLFQDDPFEAPHGELDVYLESAQPLLGQCPINTRWLRTCFAEQVVAELAGFPIACSGTVIGTAKGMMTHVIEMWNTMATLSDAAARDISDQAAHNFIVHRNQVDGMRIHANGGHVLTLHHVARDHVAIRPDGRVVGEGGVVSPILHQYDRHPMLKAYASARYPMVRTR